MRNSQTTQHSINILVASVVQRMLIKVANEERATQEKSYMAIRCQITAQFNMGTAS